MTQQAIGLGSAANDGTGDTLRAAGGKMNGMFAELYGGLPIFGGKLDTQINEYLTPAASTTFDILNVNPGTPGVVTSLWMTFGSIPVAKDGIISVYVDGESSPSVVTDMGHVGGGHLNTAAMRMSTRHITFEQSASAANPTYTFRFPIPFKSSIRITYTTPATGGGSPLWSIARYRYNLPAPIPWKLKSNGRTFPNRYSALTPAQQGDGSTIQYLNLPSGQGNSGVIAYHGIAWSEATNFTYLENNIVGYLDGRVAGSGVKPQFGSSGTEDYFAGSYYWETVPSAAPWGAVTAKGNPGGSLGAYCCHAYMDFLEYDGGIPFSDGILLTQEIGQAATPGTSTSNVSISFLLLYYVPNL